MRSNLFSYIIALTFGVTAGLTTLFVIPSQFEIAVWVLLTLFLGILSHYQFDKYKFRNAFVIAIFAGIAITLTHLYFIKQYLMTHQEEIETLDKILIKGSYRLTLLIIAPIYWIVLGALTGLTNLILGKILRTISPNR
jgi:phage shock protein PspC (stress-responsive transcriptional regulator)